MNVDILGAMPYLVSTAIILVGNLLSWAVTRSFKVDLDNIVAVSNDGEYFAPDYPPEWFVSRLALDIDRAQIPVSIAAASSSVLLLANANSVSFYIAISLIVLVPLLSYVILDQVTDPQNLYSDRSWLALPTKIMITLYLALAAAAAFIPGINTKIS